MLYFLLTSFVFTSTPAPKPGGKPSSSALTRQQPLTGPPNENETVASIPRNETTVVPIPNGLMERVQQEFGLMLRFPRLSEENFARLQVDLTYKQLPHTDGSAVSLIKKQACLDLTKYYELMKQKPRADENKARLEFSEFRDGIKQRLSEVFELAYRYLHEYRAPKHNLRWWREKLQYLERTVLGVGQIIGLGLYASNTSGAGGISFSVGSALMGLAGELVANNWKKSEENYFSMRDEIDGKIATLLSFYTQPETVDVLKLFQTIIVDVLGYGDPNIMQEKLKKSWPHMKSYFPGDNSMVSVNMSAAASSTASAAKREPADNS